MKSHGTARWTIRSGRDLGASLSSALGAGAVLTASGALAKYAPGTDGSDRTANAGGRPTARPDAVVRPRTEEEGDEHGVEGPRSVTLMTGGRDLVHEGHDFRLAGAQYVKDCLTLVASLARKSLTNARFAVGTVIPATSCGGRWDDTHVQDSIARHRRAPSATEGATV